MPELTIRNAEPTDLPRVVEIYNHYVLNTAITFDLEPYTAESRRTWFDGFATDGRYRLIVGLITTDGEEQMVGYACTQQLRHKRAYDTSVETSIYLDPEHIGQGFGAPLYAALFEQLVNEDIHQAFAGITLPNDASMRIHRQFGFESMGVWEQVGRKFDRFWDVQWMAKRMTK